MRSLRSFCACAAVLASACVPLISQRETRLADALIQETIEAGGRDEPRASTYLALAEQELEDARVRMRVHDIDGADLAARRARADADVAWLYAIEAVSIATAQRSDAWAMEIQRLLDGAPRPVSPREGEAP